MINWPTLASAFLCLLIGTACLSSASAQEIDHDLINGECAKTTMHGQPVKVCRDANGNLKISALQGQSNQIEPLNEQYKHDERKLNQISADFSAADMHDEHTLATLRQLQNVAQELQQALAKRKYDTQDLMRETLDLQDRINSQLNAANNRLIEQQSKSNNQESVQQTAIPDRLKSDSSPENPQPAISANNEGQKTQWYVYLLTSIALLITLFITAHAIRWLIRFLVHTKKSLLEKYAHISNPDARQDNFVIEYLQLQKDCQSQMILIWCSAFCLALFFFPLLPIFLILALIVTTYCFPTMETISIGDAYFSGNEHFKSAIQFLAKNSVGQCVQTFKKITANREFFLIRKQNDLLIITPRTYWVMLGKNNYTGQTCTITVNSFSFKEQVLRPQSDDEIISTVWRYAKRTNPNERDFRYNNNSSTYIVRRHGITLKLANGLEWTLKPFSQAKCSDIEKTFGIIIERNKGRANQEERTSSNYTKRNTYQRYWHEVLDVSINASQDEIRKKYLKLIKEYHPDRLKGVEGLHPDFENMANQKLAEINSAYEEAMRQFKKSASS